MLTVGIARIGNEPVIRFANDMPVLDLSLAYDYGKRGQDGKRPTQWINATFWGDRAQKLVPYLHKGNKIYVQLADIHIDTYTKKDGITASSLKATINNIELIGDKSEPKPAVKQTEETDCPF